MLVEKKSAERLREWRGRAGDKAALGVIALAVLLCEIFIFNYKYWESCLYQPVENAPCSLYGLNAVDNRYEIREQEAVLEFSDIHRRVAYLSLSLEEGQQAELQVAVVDEANASYLWAPARTVRGDVGPSQHLRLHFGDDVQRLRVVVRGLQGAALPGTQ